MCHGIYRPSARQSKHISKSVNDGGQKTEEEIVAERESRRTRQSASMRTDPNPLPTVLARLLLAVADDLASLYNNAPGGPFEHRMPLERVFPRDSTGLLYEGTFMKALFTLFQVRPSRFAL